MTTEQPRTLAQAREATIDALCKGFAEETLSMNELERRLETARSARTREELNRLLQDLPAATVPMKAAAKPAPRDRTATPARAPETRPQSETGSHLALSIMGGTRRAGRWTPPSEVVAVAIMGGVELDFRDAVLVEGQTEINCFAFWGGIDITVPAGVRVESTGFAFMGGFAHVDDLETRPGPGAPTIRINGFALMGGVDIKVAEPGSGKKR